MLEYCGVETRDVDGWEDRYGADEDGVEEELVLVDVLEDWELGGVVWVEAEEGSAEGFDFPGGDEDGPCEECEDSCSSAEDGLAGGFVTVVVIGSVTVLSETAIVDSVDDDDESHECDCAHDGSVD